MADRHISLDRVLTNAWKSMVRMLFKPFSLERWLTLGFCCWMLTLGGEMGNIGNFGSRFFKTDSSHNGDPLGGLSAQNWERLNHVLNGNDASFLRRAATELHLAPATLNLWILGITVFLLFTVVFLILCYWLHSRFEFIFLDNLTNDRNEIKRPWHEFKTLGNSYFAGTLVFVVLIFAFNLLVAGIGGGLTYSWLAKCAAAHRFIEFGQVRIIYSLLLGGVWFLTSCAIGLYFWFFFYLLVPIMYRDRIDFRDGLRRMNTVMFRNVGSCILFWLVMLVVQFGFGLIILIVGMATCCLLFIALGLPYVGAVVMLPYWTFMRLTGVELLKELDPRPEPPAAPEPSEPETGAVTY